MYFINFILNNFVVFFSLSLPFNSTDIAQIQSDSLIPPTTFAQVVRLAGETLDIDSKLFYWKNAQSLWQPKDGKIWKNSVEKQLSYWYFKKAQNYLNSYTYEFDMPETQQILKYLNLSAHCQSDDAYPYDWIFHVYNRSKHWKEAQICFLKEYEKAAKIKSKFPRTFLDISLIHAQILMHFEQTEQALNVLNSSLDCSLKYSGDKNFTTLLIKNYTLLSNIHFKNAELKKALNYTNQAFDLQPSTQDYELARTKFYSLMMLCMQNFGEQNYLKALEYHNSADKVLQINAKLKKNIESGGNWDYLKKLIEERKKIANNKVIYTHHILSVYLNKTQINEVDYAYTGKQLSVNQSIYSPMKKFARIQQNCLKQIMEATSNGNFSLQFDEYQSDIPVNKLEYWYFDRKPMLAPDLYDVISKFSSGFWYQNTRKYDSFFFYWNAKGITGDASGGILLNPYDTTVIRGRITLPINDYQNTWNNMLLYHEFFHILEFIADIRPTHGFTHNNRKAFPAWKGNGEANYYAWQLNTTFAQIGWENINFIKNSPVFSQNTELAPRDSGSYMYRNGRSRAEQQKFIDYADFRFSQSRKLPQPKSLKITADSFSFVFFSDVHLDKGLHTFAKTFYKNISPSDKFIIHGGDISSNALQTDFSEFKQIANATKLPFFSVAGNHDIWHSNDWTTYKNYFGTSSYTFTAKNIRFIVLDAGTPTLGERQRQWLESQLKNNKKKHLIVIQHIPFFFGGENNTVAFFISEKKELTQLFEKYGVEYVLAGHTHSYYYQELNGLKYVTTDCYQKKGDTYLRFYYKNDKLYFKKLKGVK